MRRKLSPNPNRDSNRYYSSYGRFLGAYGSERLILVVDIDYACFYPELTIAYCGVSVPQFSEEVENWVIEHAVPLWKASPFAIEAVIKSIARNEVGIRQTIRVEDLKKFGLYGLNTIRKSDDGKKIIRNDGIIINSKSRNTYYSNYYNIFLNLIHEQNHYRREIGIFELDSYEYDAYFEVREHDYFDFATDEYREHVRTSLRNYGVATNQLYY